MKSILESEFVSAVCVYALFSSSMLAQTSSKLLHLVIALSGIIFEQRLNKIIQRVTIRKRLGDLGLGTVAKRPQEFIT